MDSTIQKYLRDIRAFQAWIGERTVNRENTSGWKEALIREGYASSTVNAMLSSLNSILTFLGWEESRVKLLKIQRKLFRESNRDLNKTEYERLIRTAQETGNERLKLLLETICSTGIRVSELRYITADAVQKGRADVALKGKVRTIILPGKLCKKLQKYAEKKGIASGEIFLTRNGKSLGRCQIWREMKKLCEKAEVMPTKVFPHNLRHLFATTFYGIYKDIVKLADVLGHSSIDTTRIYLISTGETHARRMNRLGLIS